MFLSTRDSVGVKEGPVKHQRASHRTCGGLHVCPLFTLVKSHPPQRCTSTREGSAMHLELVAELRLLLAEVTRQSQKSVAATVCLLSPNCKYHAGPWQLSGGEPAAQLRPQLFCRLQSPPPPQSKRSNL